MPTSSILAATDFSPLSEQVVERAALLARRHYSTLHLLHVVPSFPWDSLGKMFFEHPLLTEKQLYDAAHERLREIAADAGRRHGITVQPCIDIGQPHACIAAYANKHAIGLTILGPHAVNAAKDLFIGSTALKTLRASASPILVVKQGPDKPYRKVLATVDFTEMSPRVLELAERIAPEAEIHALHVYEVMFEGKMRYAGVEDEVIQRYVRLAGREATDRMNELLRQLGRQDSIASWIRHGHPSRTIVEVAASLQADLVVMGKHGRHGIEKLMLGSVVQGVLYGLDRDLAVATAPSS